MGKIATFGDILVQRLEALELSVIDKGWALAPRLGVSDRPTGPATDADKFAAARAVLDDARLEDTRKKASPT